MLEDTRPTTFAELVRISGLSHGTDVWLNNAQDLIKNNVASLSEVISTRDDIMIYLIYRGMDPTISFQIMESVRKGRGLTSEMEDEMVKHDIPQWYIESCKKIKYMFPKAHAAAYVIMAFRIAYFKVYYPEAFYATYFTAKADDFDAELIYSGQRAVQDKIEYLQGQGRKLTAKENNLLTILEVVVEMFARGISFESIDLYKSHATKFQVTDSGIMPSRSEEHTSELQSRPHLVCRLLLEKKKNKKKQRIQKKQKHKTRPQNNHKIHLRTKQSHKLSHH